jgi:hypothetical protein
LSFDKKVEAYRQMFQQIYKDEESNNMDAAPDAVDGVGSEE